MEVSNFFLGIIAFCMVIMTTGFLIVTYAMYSLIEKVNKEILPKVDNSIVKVDNIITKISNIFKLTDTFSFIKKFTKGA